MALIYNLLLTKSVPAHATVLNLALKALTSVESQDISEVLMLFGVHSLIYLV